METTDHKASEQALPPGWPPGVPVTAPPGFAKPELPTIFQIAAKKLFRLIARRR
jgi:hypothetical protein